MTTPPLAEQITASFYAWELRGRGWQVADYRVALEPAFRPCRLLPQFARPSLPYDDGRRPTFLSGLVEQAKRLLGSTAAPLPPPEEPFEEPSPHPAGESEAPETLRVRVASGFASTPEVATHLVRSLSASLQPVSVELFGHAGSVSMQVACSPGDREHVLSHIEGYVPEAVVTDEPDLIDEHWSQGGESVVIDFGLADEFFLPLTTFPSFRVDPYIALVPALSRAREGESVCLQMLIGRTRNPWGKAIIEALCDSAGGPIFADAPEFLPLAREKVRTPLFAVVMRLAAQARTKARAFELARGAGSFVLQFGRSGSNELVPLENDNYSHDDHLAAFLARQSHRPGMLLSAEELIGLVHVPDASVRNPALVRPERRTKGVPEEAIGQPFVLGENMHRGTRSEVTLSESARLQHLHVIGASGTGKSTLLLQLITQDIASGRGLALLDPHGDLIDDVLARIPEERTGDVIVFDPADEDWPVGLNLLAAKSTLEKQILASDLVSVFQRLSTSWGDTMGTVLSNAVLALLESDTGGTLLDLRRFLVDESFRRQFLRTVVDEEVQFFWEKGFPLIGARSIGPILTRLDTFLRSKLIRHIVGQRVPRLDLASVLSEGKILLAKLSQGLIGEENASLLGSLLATRLHQLALARQHLPRDARRAFFLYADEAQHFVTPSMSALLGEGRKYGLGLVLAHQSLFQIRGSPIEGALLGNAYVRIVFRVGDDDAKKLAEGCSGFEARDIQGLGRGEAIVRIGGAGGDCNLRTLPLEAVDAAESEQRRQAIVAASRETFATPVAEVRQEWADASPPSSVPREPPVTSPAVASAALKGAPPDRPPSDEPVSSPSKPRSQASPPNVAVKPVVPLPLATLGRGGPQHKYLQHLIKRLAEERGFRAVIEEAVAGGQADVILRRDDVAIACEISITTDVTHEIENVRKCVAGGFAHVLLISPDSRRRDKCRRKLEKLALPGVTVLEPEEIAMHLDGFAAPTQPTAEVVRGYKVKVTRQQFSPEDVAARRTLVAQVIARSLGRPPQAESE